MLIAIGAIYLAYKRSPWVIAALAFAVPFAGYRDVGHTTLTVEKCLVVGAVLGMLLGGARILPQSRGARRIFIAGSLLLLTVALSSVYSTYHASVVREFFKQAEYLALFWCAAVFTERVERAQGFFIAGAVAATAIVSTVAVSQAIVGGAPSGIWVNGHPLPRVAAQLEGPNQLAGFLEAALPILWTLPMLTSSWRPLRAYVTSASSAALVLTQSRSGFLVAVLSYLALWRIHKDVARATAVATVLGAVVGFVVSAIWFIFSAHAIATGFQRVFMTVVPMTPGGVGTRGQLWPAAIELFRRHPLLGVGAGNFELLLPSVGLHGVHTHAGSLWLQTLAEQGVLGFLALIVWAVIAIRETFQARNTALGLAAFLAVASLLVHQLADDLFFFPKVAGLCWLLLGAGTSHLIADLGPRRNGRSTGVENADNVTVDASSPGTPRLTTPLS